MSRSEAELTLVLKARNLAGTALSNVETAIERVKTKAGQVAGAFRKAFAGLGGVLNMAVSGLAYDLAHGSTAQAAFQQFGLTMAILAGETFIANMGGTIAEKIASSAIIGKIGAQLAILGAAMGGIVDTAMGIAMAALPFVLIAVIVAAIAAIIFDEGIRNKVFAFAGQVITNIANGLGTLGATLLDLFGKGVNWVTTNIGPFVGGLVKAIVDGLVSLPGKIADLIRDGLMSMLPINIGPLHITASGVTLDLPDLNLPSSSPGAQMKPGQQHHASGGWVGLHGPELTWAGESGPEYIHPNHGGGVGGGSGVTLVGVSEQQLTDMIERNLYFRLQRAAPTLSRT